MYISRIFPSIINSSLFFSFSTNLLTFGRMTSGDSKKPLIMEDLLLLNNNDVKMKDPTAVLEKINKIISGGKDKLQLIMDYDLTMTKQHINGNRTLSSFGLLCLCKHLPPNFVSSDQKIKDKYYPIEIDPTLTTEEKTPHMIEWYAKAEELWNGVEFDLKELHQVVEKSGPELRDGTVEFCKSLETNKVPLLILSAGLGNVLTEVLKHHGLVENDYFHVVSNFFKLENGIVRGYGCHENGSFIHPFNKNGFGCSDYFKRIGSNRHNVILIGDSLGDAEMDKGVPEISTVLKIGFLYGTPSFIESSLPRYINTFDIVLVDDQTMNIPKTIVDAVVS